MCEIEARYKAYVEHAEAEIKHLEEWIARLMREREMERPFICTDCGCKQRKCGLR